jgi:hypothetical protein
MGEGGGVKGEKRIFSLPSPFPLALLGDVILICRAKAFACQNGGNTNVVFG